MRAITSVSDAGSLTRNMKALPFIKDGWRLRLASSPPLSLPYEANLYMNINRYRNVIFNLRTVTVLNTSKLDTSSKLNTQVRNCCSLRRRVSL